MKKLMLTLAAIAIAGIVQAASVDWSTDKNAFLMKSGANASGVSVYLLYTGASDYASVVSGLAAGTVTAANITSKSAYVGTGTTGTTSKKYGSVAQTTVTSDAFTEGNNYNFAYVVFEKITTGENAGDWYYLSGAESGSAWKDGTESIHDLATVAKWSASTYSASNWAKAAPEPTSGVLMLIGLGALALRRRRA